jgi:peptidylamidoglycolate lyase
MPRTVSTGAILRPLAWVICLTALVGAQAPRVGVMPAETEVHPRGGEEETGHYYPVADWPKPLPNHAGWTWGSTAGVFAESPNRIFIFQRGELPARPSGAPELAAGLRDTERRMEHCLLIVNGEGALIDSWTQHDKLFKSPHRVLISPYDPAKHVWLVDDGTHQVFKFTNDGKLVMTLGEAGVAGDDARHFARPTDIAWLPDGTFFVTDGYTNTRVVKFDREGRYLTSWGRRGKGPGEFNTVHGIAIDANRRLYVADRENNRIQIFDENGKFVDEWPYVRSALHLLMSGDQHLWISDGVTNKILKYDLTGRLLYGWGTRATFPFPGSLWAVHQISVDQDGNFYTAEVFGGKAQKFRPKRGADPSKLIVPPRYPGWAK